MSLKCIELPPLKGLAVSEDEYCSATSATPSQENGGSGNKESKEDPWPYDRQPGWSYYDSSQSRGNSQESQPSETKVDLKGVKKEEEVCMDTEDCVKCTPGMQISDCESPVALTQAPRPSPESLGDVNREIERQGIQKECITLLRQKYQQEMHKLQMEFWGTKKEQHEYMKELISFEGIIGQELTKLQTRAVDIDVRQMKINADLEILWGKINQLEEFNTSFCTPDEVN